MVDGSESAFTAEISVPSEVVNMLNFVALDLLLLPYVMFVSGRLAGYANYDTLRKGDPLTLTIFDPPLVGGGIVMARSKLRALLIAARISVVAAVAMCNFGLEGRSTIRYLHREVTVRRPGHMTTKSLIEIYDATERRMRCSGSTEDDQIFFGAVFDNRCYLSSDEFVFIRALGYDYVDIHNISAVGCKHEARCQVKSTIFRCNNVDMRCGGLLKKSQCRRKNGINTRACISVIYSNDSEYAWICNQGWLAPGEKNKTLSCRTLSARREDIAGWVDYLWEGTFDPLTSIFAAAYGEEQRRVVRIPDGEAVVTVVGVWWFIPTAWVIFVAAILSFLLCRHHRGNSQLFAHDERGLANLLEREMKVYFFDENELAASGVVIIGARGGSG